MRETRRELEGGWSAIYEMGNDCDGNPAVVDLRITPTEPGVVPRGGITGTLLRAVPMGRVRAQTYEELANAYDSYEELTAEATDAGATYADFGRQLEPPPTRGRKTDPEFLLLVATIWDQLVHTSKERSLYRGLIAELERRGFRYGREGARTLVRKARWHGLLEDPPSRGRIGGGLTAKARQLLRDQRP